MEHINGYGVSYTSSACLLKAIQEELATPGPCACLLPASMDFVLTASTLYGDGNLNLSHLREKPCFVKSYACCLYITQRNRPSITWSSLLYY